MIWYSVWCLVLPPGLLIYDISPGIYGLSLRSTYLWKTNVKSYMELHKQILVVCHINIIRSVILSWWAKQNDSFMILNIVPPQSTHSTVNIPPSFYCTDISTFSLVKTFNVFFKPSYICSFHLSVRSFLMWVLFSFYFQLWWKSVKLSRYKVHNVSGWHSSCDLHDNSDGGHSGSGDVQGEKMLHKL